MAQATTERVSGQELNEGDTVTVHVNRRASDHLGVSAFEAVVEDAHLDTVIFRPIEQLQRRHDCHTWYSDSGYIHGFHEGVGGYSDIGKVARVER